MTYLNAKLWQEAWDSKLQSIMDHSIFSKPVIILKRHNIIMSKVDWNIKYAKNSSIARHKACLVARSLFRSMELTMRKYLY